MSSELVLIGAPVQLQRGLEKEVAHDDQTHPMTFFHEGSVPDGSTL
jgi:hypothetical protein